MLVFMWAKDTENAALLTKIGEFEANNTLPNDLSELNLPSTFWKAVSDGWSEIKDSLGGKAKTPAETPAMAPAKTPAKAPVRPALHPRHGRRMKDSIWKR
jgi:hypothetical protein